MSDSRHPDEPNRESTDESFDESFDESTDAPLVEREDLVLDVVDGVATGEAVDARQDAAALAALIEGHEMVRAAVGADVVAPDLVRERALRAAMATPMDRVDEPSEISTAPTSTGSSTSTVTAAAPDRHRRTQPQRAGWLLPVLGAAAALVLLVGVAVIFLRGGSSSTTAATGSADQYAAPASGSAVSGEAAPEAASTGANSKLASGSLSNFGSVSDPADLAARVDSTQLFSAQNQVAGAPATTALGRAAADAARSVVTVPCEAEARGSQARYADATITIAGLVRYQDQDAVALVFSPPAPDQGRYLVALSTAGCRVLVDTPI